MTKHLFTGFAVLVAIAAPASAAAPFAPVEGGAVTSQSRQFLVQGESLGGAPTTIFQLGPNDRSLLPSAVIGSGPSRAQAFYATGPTNQVLLDPNYLAVSAELVKHQLLKTLDLKDAWRGKIYFQIRPTDGEPVRVNAMYEPLARAWIHHVSVPQTVEPEKLLREVTKALLSELAHREAGNRRTDLPAWLREGMVAHLEANNGTAAFMRQDERVARISILGRNNTAVTDPYANIGALDAEQTAGLHVARRQVVEQAMRDHHVEVEFLTFEQLSWPDHEVWAADDGERFRQSARVLVEQLMELPGGRENLAQTIRLLPHYQNWQFAFLAAFRDSFPTLLDAEKWWTVTTIHHGNRDFKNRWSHDESVARLEALLRPSLARQDDPDAEPVTVEMNLEELIAEVSFADHRPVLNRLINQLQALELRSARALAPIVRDYRLACESYLRDMSQMGGGGKRNLAASPVVARGAFLRQLERLEETRGSLRDVMATARRMQIETSAAPEDAP